MSGHVVREVAGLRASAEDAVVKVWWTPGAGEVPLGHEVPVRSVANVPVAADGSYQVHVPPTARMHQQAARNGGWVNLSMAAVDPSTGQSTLTTVSRHLVAGGWLPGRDDPQSVDPGATDPRSMAAVAGADSTESALVTGEDPESPASRAAVQDLFLDPASAGTASDAAPASINESQATGSVPCGFIVTSRPVHHVNVVEFHNAANSDAGWSYGKQADSDIQGGLQLSGTGAWKIRGTYHVGNSTSSLVGRNYSGGTKANNFGTSDFKFVNGYYKAYGGGGSVCSGTSVTPGTKKRTAYKWVAGVGKNNHAGSEYIGCLHDPQKKHRSYYPRGAYFERGSKSAARIGAAADIGPIYVGATSGYSTHVSLHWKSKRGDGIWLCGTNYDVTSAGVIHASSRS